MSVADPLIKRALTLRTAYVWGRGVTINAAQEDGSEQDVDAVIQAFLDDPSNRDTFASLAAHQERERTLGTDGNVLLSLITDPLTGRVGSPAARGPDRRPGHQPEDEAEVWLYKREWRSRVVEAGTLPSTTRTRWETRRAYYPALGFARTSALSRSTASRSSGTSRSCTWRLIASGCGACPTRMPRSRGRSPSATSVRLGAHRPRALPDRLAGHGQDQDRGRTGPPATRGGPDRPRRPRRGRPGRDHGRGSAARSRGAPAPPSTVSQASRSPPWWAARSASPSRFSRPTPRRSGLAPGRHAGPAAAGRDEDAAGFARFDLAARPRLCRRPGGQGPSGGS